MSSMRFRGSLIANISWLVVGEVFSKLLGFVATVVLVRRLGNGSFGDYIVASSIAGYALLLSVAGGESLPVRLLKQLPGSVHRIMRSVIKLRFSGAVVTAAILVLIPYVLPLTQQQRAILLLHAILIPGSVLNASYVLQSHERMDLLAAGRVCQAVLYLTGTVLCIHGGDDVILVTAVHGVASLMFAVCTLIPMLFWRGKVKEEVSAVSVPSTAALMPMAIPMVASGFLMTVYYSLDSVMLGMLRGAEEAGMYGAAYRIVLFLLGGGTLVYQASMTRLASPESIKRRKTLQLFIIAQMMLGLGAGLFLVAFSESSLVLFYGEQCRPVVPALRVLSIAVMFGIINMGILSPMLLHGMEKQRMYVLVIAAIVNVGLNSVLIPEFGMEGAAWATAGAELCVFAINIPRLREVMRSRPDVGTVQGNK